MSEEKDDQVPEAKRKVTGDAKPKVAPRKRTKTPVRRTKEEGAVPPSSSTKKESPEPAAESKPASAEPSPPPLSQPVSELTQKAPREVSEKSETPPPGERQPGRDDHRRQPGRNGHPNNGAPRQKNGRRDHPIQTPRPSARPVIRPQRNDQPPQAQQRHQPARGVDPAGNQTSASSLTGRPVAVPQGVPLPLERGMNPDPAAVHATPASIAADRKAFLEPEPPKMPRGAENLTLLGNAKTAYSDQYSPVILEWFENRHREYDYWVKFNCPEFTSLCPITGQPDFAAIYISYIPDRRMVESKSLKLYLFGFRNHGAFHEDCVNIIMKDLIRLMSPRYIEVWGKFLPRGGISIDPYCNYGRPGTRFEEFARQKLLMHDLNLERIDNR